MAYRFPADFAFGSLNAAISISDTVLSSDQFSTLRVMSSGTSQLPITLLDPALRLYETVWITLHSEGATTATVSRGKENSAAQAWPAGTQWLCSPTTRDVAATSAVGALPADAHVGMRVVLSDLGEVHELTWAQGWMGSVRANRADMGRSLDGTASPGNGHIPILKALTAQGTTNATGYLSVTLPNGGFPTRLITASLVRAGGGTWFSPTLDPTFSTKTVVSVLATNSSGTGIASLAISVGIIAIGY